MIRTKTKKKSPKCNIDLMTEEEKLRIATANQESRRELFQKKLGETLEHARKFGLLFPTKKAPIIKECPELCDDDLKSVKELLLTKAEKLELKNLMIPIRRGFKELTSTVRQALKEDLILKRLDSFKTQEILEPNVVDNLDDCVKLKKIVPYKKNENTERLCEKLDQIRIQLENVPDEKEENCKKSNEALRTCSQNDPEVVKKAEKLRDFLKELFPEIEIIVNAKGQS